MPKSKQKADCLLSVKEVAEIIGLDATTIRNGQCCTDELLRIKLGARTLFSFNDVQEWMNRKIKEARAAKERQEDAKFQLLQRRVFDKATVRDLFDTRSSNKK